MSNDVNLSNGIDSAAAVLFDEGVNADSLNRGSDIWTVFDTADGSKEFAASIPAWRRIASSGFLMVGDLSADLVGALIDTDVDVLLAVAEVVCSPRVACGVFATVDGSFRGEDEVGLSI